MSMIETLVDGGNDKRKIVVAGEMLELGENEAKSTAKPGKIAVSGIDMLIGVRGLAKEMVEGANEAGIENAEFVERFGRGRRFCREMTGAT